MEFYTTLLRQPGGQSKFRTFAIIISVVLATLILASVLSIGQGWMARSEKGGLVSALFRKTDSQVNQGNLVYFSTYESKIGDRPVEEVGIYKTNPGDILPAGLTAMPADNELWVTPALKRLIEGSPLLAGEYKNYIIRDSFPIELAPSPDSLLLLYKIKTESLGNSDNSIGSISPEKLWNTYEAYKTDKNSQSILSRTALLVTGVVVIVPLLFLVTEVSKIGITQRRKKYATLSLIGATDTQIRRLILFEVLILSLVGAVLGAVLFVLGGMLLLVYIPIGGEVFWRTDLTMSVAMYVAICVAITSCSVFANLQGLRSITISALTVTRTNNDIRRPSVVSLIPLFVGVASLYLLSEYGARWYLDNSEVGGIVLICIIAMILIGIVVAGPFIVFVFSAIFARLSSSVSTMLATHRLRLVARKTFRSIGGIVLALFVGTILMTLLATIQASTDAIRIKNGSEGIDNLYALERPLQITVDLPRDLPMSQTLIKTFTDSKEVADLIKNSYVQEGFVGNDTGYEQEAATSGNYYGSCSQLRERTDLDCGANIPADSSVIATLQVVNNKETGRGVLQPTVEAMNKQDGTLYDKSYVFIAKDTDTFSRAIDLIYAITSRYYRSTGAVPAVQYRSLEKDTMTQTIQNISAPVLAVIAMTLIIGGLSLSVGIIGGIFERKKTFVQLRIIGAPLGLLVKVLFIEIITPLVILTAIVVGLGIFCCYHVLNLGRAFDSGGAMFSVPGLIFWASLCIAIALCSTSSLITVPLLNKITDLKDLHSE